MDIKQQAIHEYLEQGIGYRTLAKKYGVSRTTINKWVMIHQGIHNLPPTEKQQKYYLSKMNNNSDNVAADDTNKQKDLEEKIRLLEKQLELFFCYIDEGIKYFNPKFFPLELLF